MDANLKWLVGMTLLVASASVVLATLMREPLSDGRLAKIHETASF